MTTKMANTTAAEKQALSSSLGSPMTPNGTAAGQGTRDRDTSPPSGMEESLVSIGRGKDVGPLLTCLALPSPLSQLHVCCSQKLL